MRTPPRTNHWDDHARQWSRIATPLRPHGDDEKNLKHALGNTGGLHLLLGVTPEYAKLFERVVAVDHSAAMIRALWPEKARGKDAIQANWLHLPLKENSCDACIGDGCLNIFSYPSQYGPFFHELRHALRAGARFALRVFIRPATGETCAAVCEHARRAGIGSFHAFKWRLAMAIAAESGDSNVRVAHIREVFVSLLPDREQLAAASGWSVDDIGTIDAYRDAAASYSFPTLSQLRGSVPACFKEIDLRYGSYELSERCPMLVLELGK